MAKDEAIRNQKVFVRMDSVLHFQRIYTRQTEATKKSNEEDSKESNQLRALNNARQEVYERIIQVLDLPII